MIPYENPLVRIGLGTVLNNPALRLALTEQELGEHVSVLGQIGSGKSRLLQEIARQIILQRGGLAVLDPAGDLVEDLVLWIAENNDQFGPFVLENVTVFEANERHAFSIDPLCYRRGTPGDANHHAFLLTKADWISYGILRTVGQMGYNDTRRLARFLPAAVYACGVPLDDHGHHIPLSKIGGFVDPFHAEYGRLYERVEGLLPDEIRSVFDLMHSFDDRHDVLDYTESTINLEQTLFKGLTGAIFSDEAEPFDFQKLIRRGGVLLANLRQSDFGLSEHQASALGFFLQSELASAAELMSRDQRTAFTVMVDEASRFVDAKLGDTLRNSRKWGLSYVLAAQDITSLSYGGTDLKEIIWGVPNTKIAFQQILGDDLEFLAPTFLYGNLNTTPLVSEVQRVAGHALVPVLEHTQRHEKAASHQTESSVTNSEATSKRRQEEQATIANTLQRAATTHTEQDRRDTSVVNSEETIREQNQTRTDRSEETSGSRRSETKSDHQISSKSVAAERALEHARRQAQRTEEVARDHAGETTTEEQSAGTLTRDEQRRIHTTAQDQINTMIDAQELAEEHATARTHENSRVSKVQHSNERRSEESVAKLSGHRSTDAEQTRIDEVYSTEYTGNSGRSLTTRRTFDSQHERTDFYGTTLTDKRSEAQVRTESDEQATKDAHTTSDTKIARSRHADEQQQKLTTSDQQAAAHISQQDHVNRTAVANVQGHDVQNTSAQEQIESSADLNTHRAVTSESDEQTAATEQARTQEQRSSIVNEDVTADRKQTGQRQSTTSQRTLADERASEQATSNETRRQQLTATGIEQQRALSDKRQHATTEATTHITADRNLLLPVHELVPKPTGQWKESEDQQKAKTKNGLAGLAKRECKVRFRERPAVDIRVVEVDDAYGELPAWLRMDILRDSTNFLVKKQPSCFIPDLTIQAEQRRLPELFAALDQAKQLKRLPAPPPARIFVLPPAALPAPATSRFGI